MLAGMSGNNRCHWRSLLVAGAVFGELGRCFESLETLVLRDCLYLWCRAWWSFCAARAVLLMPQAPFSQQVQYFRDLEEKVPDSRVKHGFCTCSICVIRSIDFFVERALPGWNACHFDFVRVGSLSIWRGVHFDLAHASFSALWHSAQMTCLHWQNLIFWLPKGSCTKIQWVSRILVV